MELLEMIKNLSLGETKTLEQIALKLSEETGEVSQALLSYLKASGCEYKKLGSEDVKEECIDVILVALSLFYKLDGTDDELIDTITKKSNKWKNKSNIKDSVDNTVNAKVKEKVCNNISYVLLGFKQMKLINDISIDFMNKMNPDKWSGENSVPTLNFQGRMIYTHENFIKEGYDLDISFDYLKEHKWTHLCELREHDSEELLEIQSGKEINSVKALEDTIASVCINAGLILD